MFLLHECVRREREQRFVFYRAAALRTARSTLGRRFHSTKDPLHLMFIET